MRFVQRKILLEGLHGKNHRYYFLFEIIESVTKCERVSLVLSAELVNAQPSPLTPAMHCSAS